MVSQANVNTQDASKHRLGWHWVWFLPLCVLVLSLVERHAIIYAFELLKLGYQRWSWGVFFSPSAFFYLHVMAASVIWPVFGLGTVALLVGARQPWRYPLLLIVGILLLPFAAEALIWGSFPFTFDDHGIGRLRMIPFVPWPSAAYGEY